MPRPRAGPRPRRVSMPRDPDVRGPVRRTLISKPSLLVRGLASALGRDEAALSSPAPSGSLLLCFSPGLYVP